VFDELGKNKKLNFTGRPSDVAGVIATGKLYTLGDQTIAFFPQVNLFSQRKLRLLLVRHLQVETAMKAKVEGVK
jgi:hypothetical protein